MSGPNVTELIVVRHGETVWNVAGRQQGQMDSDLSPLGERQAEAIAESLASQSFDALYSSDLGRAYKTAEHIASRTGHKILPDARLRERHLGVFQGLTFAEVKQRYPDEYARYRAGDPEYVIPSGESARQRFERAVQCAQEIAGGHVGLRVVIVTHGGILDAFFRHAIDLSLSAPRRFKLFNASISTFFVEDGEWMLGTWGDIQHLRDIGTIDDW